MPTNTYTELRRQVVGTATSSVTFDLTGITGYADLRVVINGACDTGTANVLMRYNNDSTSTLYSATWMTGSGTAATSGRNGTQNQIILNYEGYMDTTYRTNLSVDIFQYANSSVFKTNLSRANNAANGTSANVGLWRNTAAITSITIITGSNNFAVGSTFSLYGIKAVGGDTGVKALGGTITEDATHFYHTFKGASSFTPLQSLTADILIVAGGGGGATAGGGGGGGGLLGFAAQSLTAQTYSVIVGAGGSGSRNLVRPTNGSDSKFGTLTTAIGGGRGAGYVGEADYFSALTGGSGGGGAFNASGQFSSGTSGQGNAGNNGYQDPGGGAPRSGGGGGGAGGAATNGGVANVGANGGVGATNGSTVGGTAGPYSFINAMGAASGTGQLSGGNYYYAGGGGGDGTNIGGSGGLGGGGLGGSEEPPVAGSAGTAFTGGGAGSTGGTPTGLNGGSGVVIVRYTKA